MGSLCSNSVCHVRHHVWVVIRVGRVCRVCQPCHIWYTDNVCRSVPLAHMLTHLPTVASNARMSVVAVWDWPRIAHHVALICTCCNSNRMGWWVDGAMRVVRLDTTITNHICVMPVNPHAWLVLVQWMHAHHVYSLTSSTNNYNYVLIHVPLAIMKSQICVSALDVVINVVLATLLPIIVPLALLQTNIFILAITILKITVTITITSVWKCALTPTLQTHWLALVNHANPYVYHVRLTEYVLHALLHLSWSPIPALHSVLLDFI